MTESEKQEINKTIAEFMGWTDLFQNLHYGEQTGDWYGYDGDDLKGADFTESLDALVPVWKELNAGRANIQFALLELPSEKWLCNVSRHRVEAESYRVWLQVGSITAQGAAAKATAEVIKKLNN